MELKKIHYKKEEIQGYEGANGEGFWIEDGKLVATAYNDYFDHHTDIELNKDQTKCIYLVLKNMYNDQ